jgi:uncharacterized LabA/DUF88 family protein
MVSAGGFGLPIILPGVGISRCRVFFLPWQEPSVARTAIFIDGGYLDHVLAASGFSGRIDLSRLSAHLAGSSELLRTCYYHCLPYQSDVPTSEEAARFARMQRFLDALERLPRYLVRTGQLVRRGSYQDGSPVLEQKQVDILLALDVALLAVKRQVTEMVLVTGDSDFLPALRIARDEGVLVRLAHRTGSQAPHRTLWTEADERIPLAANVLRTLARP